jgi:hypothetical protein
MVKYARPKALTSISRALPHGGFMREYVSMKLSRRAQFWLLLIGLPLMTSAFSHSRYLGWTMTGSYGRKLVTA